MPSPTPDPDSDNPNRSTGKGSGPTRRAPEQGISRAAVVLPWADPVEEPPPPFAPGSRRAGVSSRSSARDGDRWGRRLTIAALAVAGALVGVLASARPTVFPVVDAVLRGLVGAGVVVAASQARRWSLLVLAGGAAALSVSPGSALAGFGALALAVGLIVFDQRRDWLTAVVGLLAVTALFHLPQGGGSVVTLFVVVVAVAPVLWSAYRVQRRGTRRRIRRAAAVPLALVGLMLAGFALAVVVGGGHADRGLTEARSGLAAARTGDDVETNNHLERATSEFDAARRDFSAWYAQPSRVLPIVGAQTEALGQLSEAGHDLVATAHDASARANYRSIDVVDGRIDATRISALAGPLDDVAAALDRATAQADRIDTGWLVPPLGRRVDSLRRQVASASDETATARQAVQIAPDLLGENGVRHYFIAFLNPAESRASGGFMGNWAELTADHGKLSLTRSGRAGDLGPGAEDGPRTLVAPADYLARYGNLHPEEDLRDVTLSPDFPSVAAAVSSVYPQTVGGSTVDGVIAMDPVAIAAMLEITGPVKVEGLTEPLTADNAADYLLRRQYLEFDTTGQKQQRVDVLEDAGRKTFDAFLHTRSLRPGRLANVFSSIVQQRRMTVMAARPEEESFVARIGLDGAFPARGTGDFAGLVTQNAGNNKIDIYLHRSVTYDVSYDPANGAVKATATIRLHNDAPSSGLPAYVIGNRPDSHQPDGVNWLWFNFYTPQGLQSSTLDGQPLAMGGADEFGMHVYQTYLPVPSGGDAVVVLELQGTIEPSSTYHLATYQQPMVNPDQMTLSLSPVHPWRASGAGGQPVSRALDAESSAVEVTLHRG